VDALVALDCLAAVAAEEELLAPGGAATHGHTTTTEQHGWQQVGGRVKGLAVIQVLVDSTSLLSKLLLDRDTLFYLVAALAVTQCMRYTCCRVFLRHCLPCCCCRLCFATAAGCWRAQAA
jgi:hypothetical protein